MLILIKKNTTKLIVFLAFLFGGFIAANPVSAEETETELLNKALKGEDISELVKELEKAQDLMKELQKEQGLGDTQNLQTMMSRGTNPVEENERRINAINLSYRNFVQNRQYYTSSSVNELIPIPYATRVVGKLIIKGKDSDSPINGWIPFKLNYTVQENFVGNLNITRFYNPVSAEFTDIREYMLGTISTGAFVPSKVDTTLRMSGKACIKTDSPPHVQCQEWEGMTKYKVSEGDIYPAVHDWVVGMTTDNHKVVFEIETPSLLFSSSYDHYNRSSGCYVSPIEKSLVEFEENVHHQNLTINQQIGSPSTSTPRCEPGSTMSLELTICDVKNFTELDQCDQLGKALEAARFALYLADLFKKFGNAASSDKELMKLVINQIRKENPDTNIENTDAYLNANAGGFRTCSGKKTVPDYCAIGCMPRPLCEWITKAINAHEDIHGLDVANEAQTVDKICKPHLHGLSDKKANELNAEFVARTDANAYTEQAQYLVDIVRQQITNSSLACTPSTDVLLDFEELESELYGTAK